MMNRAYYLVTGGLGIFAGFAAVVAMLQPSPALCRQSVVALWAIVPPLWFFFEYHLFRDRLTPAQYERLKDSQALGTRLWAGFTVVLVTLFLKGAGV